MVIPCLCSFTVPSSPSAEPPINKKRTRTLSRKESGSSTNCMVGDTPRMCEVYALDPTYRKLVADQYLVFYHVNENVKVVEIHRVLRGSWNLPQYLE